jgi:UDP-N-acetylmuramyl pentapeptide synthase
MGLRREGDARALAAAVVPDVLVLTPLAPSFSNDLAFLDTMEREISWLAHAVANRGGRIIACGDDPRLIAATSGVPSVRMFARNQAQRDGAALRLEIDGQSFPVGLDVVGDSSTYALVAGVEVARALGVKDGEIRRFLVGVD